MTIEEILNHTSAESSMAALREKIIHLRPWHGRGGLEMEYDSRLHPVMNRAKYPDIANGQTLVEVTRIPLDLQHLAAKRMTELVCGIPIQRVYSPQNDKQKEVSVWLENIYRRNRIDSVNVERLNSLFSACETMTLWYAVEERNNAYGFSSPLKLRCRTFSPMHGDALYPLFDEQGDLVAMSVAYTAKRNGREVSYFDTYTKDRHVKWSNADGSFIREEDEPISILKIPAVYAYRPSPIWENTSQLVYEMEWALSRNGNYLRDNAKPLFCVFSDEQILYGDEKGANDEGRAVAQYPSGATAQYITWSQATESLKYHLSELRGLYFTQLQLPDWSYEKMSQQALSGESRKQLFIDSQLKVKDESGRILEMCDRETNILRAFLKVIAPAGYEADIDALPIETIITPFSITDDKDTITNLVTATGGKAIMSQREAIANLGWSSDVDKTMQELQNESMAENFADLME